MLEVFDQEESGWFHSGAQTPGMPCFFCMAAEHLSEDYSGLEAFLQAVLPHPVSFQPEYDQHMLVRFFKY